MLLAGLVGCSPQGSDTSTPSRAPGPATSSAETTPASPPVTAAPPDQARVAFGGNDGGTVTAIGCATDGGLTMITIEAGQHTTVVLTDEDAPVVKSVSVGEVGSDRPSLAYVEGVSAAPAEATRDGGTYTITGTGMGTDAANPTAPVEMPFEISVTCP
jgi:lipoprotein LpqH